MAWTKRLKPTRTALIGVIVLVGLIGAAAWEVLFPHVYETGAPLAVAQARSGCPIALPDSATNVRIATYRQWIAFAEYVRFEAPAGDCQAQAAALTHDTAPKRMDESDGGSWPAPLNPGGAFGDLGWFDLASIRHGQSYGAGGPGEARVYIDLDRGIFYYVRTD